MSSHTSTSHAVVKCHCRSPCHLFRSRRDASYGRQFYRCVNNRTPIDCNFFLWLDDNDEATSGGAAHGGRTRA